MLYLILILYYLLTCDASISRLYSQDPHDVQHPNLPEASCVPTVGPYFDIYSGISAVESFCTIEDGVLSAMYQYPVSRLYVFSNIGNSINIRITLAWDTTEACKRSQLTISPIDHSGRICKTIFRNILLGCE